MKEDPLKRVLWASMWEEEKISAGENGVRGNEGTRENEERIWRVAWTLLKKETTRKVQEKKGL